MPAVRYAVCHLCVRHVPADLLAVCGTHVHADRYVYCTCGTYDDVRSPCLLFMQQISQQA